MGKRGRWSTRESLLWTLKRFWCSAAVQLVVKVGILGMGLYVTDIVTDVLAFIRYMGLVNSENARFLVLCMGLSILLPGLITAVLSILSDGKLDVGVGEPAVIKGGEPWITWLLWVPGYLLIMPWWWPVIPVLRYVDLGRHLWLEARDPSVEFQPRLVHRVAEARRMEGLVETTAQLSAHFVFAVASAFVHYGEPADHPTGGEASVMRRLYADFLERPTLANFLIYLQMLTSLAGLLKTTAETPRFVLEAGRTREPGAAFTASYVAFVAFELIHKAMLYIYLYMGVGLLNLQLNFTTVSSALLTLALLYSAHFFIHRAHIREAKTPNLLSDSLLSLIVPVNFPTASEARASSFLYWTKGAHLCLTLAVWGMHLVYFASADGDEEEEIDQSPFENDSESSLGAFAYLELALTVTLPMWVTFGLSLLVTRAFYKYGLCPVILLRHLAHPAMEEEGERRKSFPPDFAEMLLGGENHPAIEDIVNRGHFYADIRLTRPITACFACGYKKSFLRDEEEQVVEEGDFHLWDCPVYGHGEEEEVEVREEDDQDDAGDEVMVEEGEENHGAEKEVEEALLEAQDMHSGGGGEIKDEEQAVTTTTAM